jgi:hypothetical protein
MRTSHRAEIDWLATDASGDTEQQRAEFNELVEIFAKAKL